MTKISTAITHQVVPKPILTLMNLAFPLATSDLGSEALENEFMMNSMHLFEVCS
jgi:chromosome transmission fidelity protein 4